MSQDHVTLSNGKRYRIGYDIATERVSFTLVSPGAPEGLPPVLFKSYAEGYAHFNSEPSAPEWIPVRVLGAGRDGPHRMLSSLRGTVAARYSATGFLLWRPEPDQGLDASAYTPQELAEYDRGEPGTPVRLPACNGYGEVLARDDEDLDRKILLYRQEANALLTRFLQELGGAPAP